MTDVPLKEHLELRVSALERVVATKFDGMDLAIRISAETLTERLAHSNGLIEQMRQKEAHLAQKIEVADLARRVAVLEQLGAGSEGKVRGAQPLAAIWLIVISAVVSAAVTLVSRGVAQ